MTAEEKLVLYSFICSWIKFRAKDVEEATRMIVDVETFIYAGDIIE